jgi:hypothetical protein
LRECVVLTLAACLACASVSGEPVTSPDRVRDAQASWQSFKSDSMLTPNERADRVNRFVDSHGALLTFWLADSLSDSARQNFEIYEHPCGESTAALVRRIPTRHVALGIEWILEIDSLGTVLKRWPVPTDEMPWGVRGSELLLAGPVDSVLQAISADGTFRYVADSRAIEVGEELSCPSIPEFGGSDYLRCAVFTDGPRRRILAFQGVCT